MSEPSIVFEDEYFLVLNKPAGMVVNRADTVKGKVTLQDWIEERLKVQGSRFKVEEESDFIRRSGIVHRIDKETSGLILVAKDESTFYDLQKQFKEGSVEKAYIGLCHGKVQSREGEINVPVGRLPWDRKKFGVVPLGRESRTLYKVLEYKTLKIDRREEILSLLELYPKTGRTHQIRVHLRYVGHPIFADALYAGRKNIRTDRKLLSRQFLHAAKMSFTHPKTGERLTFESPLSPELVEFLSTLG